MAVMAKSVRSENVDGSRMRVKGNWVGGGMASC